MLEYKCEREGTHFVAVDPAGTTKECASGGVLTDKLLWVRKRSCPACGFEADRDANAVARTDGSGGHPKTRSVLATVWNILSRGLEDLGAGCSESTSSESQRDSDVRTRAKLSLTCSQMNDLWHHERRLASFERPVETAFPVDTRVSPKRVVEAGSPITRSQRLLVGSQNSESSGDTLKREPSGER